MTKANTPSAPTTPYLFEAPYTRAHTQIGERIEGEAADSYPTDDVRLMTKAVVEAVYRVSDLVSNTAGALLDPEPPAQFKGGEEPIYDFQIGLDGQCVFMGFGWVVSGQRTHLTLIRQAST